MSGGNFFSRMNPTLRGFLILAAIAAVIVVLQLQATLAALLIIARIAFILAIAFFIYLIWRERREEISQWPLRARVVFYGSALLAVADLGVNWYAGAHGGQILAFVAVLVLCGFAMYRTWRDQHTYV
jgi:small-conductance mechanosensitive channel